MANELLGLEQQAEPANPAVLASRETSVTASKADVEELLAIKLMLSPSADLTSLSKETEAEVGSTPDREVLFGNYLYKFKAKTGDEVVEATRSALKAGADVNTVLRGAQYAQAYMQNFNSDKDMQLMLSTIAGNMRMPETKALTMQANMSAYKRIEDLRKAGGTDTSLDTAGSVAGMLFLADSWLDTNRAVTKLGFKDFEEMFLAYQAKNPFEKQQAWTQEGGWAEAIWEATDGNHLKAAAMISKLQGPNPEMSQFWDVAFDVMSVADYAGGVYALSKLARNSMGAISKNTEAVVNAERAMSAAGRLKAAGSNQGAADAVLVKAADPKSPEDISNAAKAVSPFNYTGTVIDNAGTIDGVSPEVLRRLAENKATVTEDQFLADAERIFREDLALRLETDAENLAYSDRITISGAKDELRQINESIASGEYTGTQLKELKANAKRLEQSISDFNKAQANVMRAGKVRKGGKLSGSEAAALRTQQIKLRKALREAPETPESAARAAREAEVLRIEQELQIKLDNAAETLRAKGGKSGVDAALKAAREEHSAEAARIAALERRGLVSPDEAKGMLAESAAGRRLADAEDLARLHKEQRPLAIKLAKLRSRDYDDEIRARIRGIGERAAADQASKLGVRQEVQAARAASAPDASPVATVDKVIESATGTPQKFKSAVPEMQELIDQSSNGIRTFIAPFKTGDGFINPAKAAYIRDTIDKETLSAKDSIREAEVLSVKDNEFTVAYRTASGAETKTYKWTIDEAGAWNTEHLDGGKSAIWSAAVSGILSPSALFRELDRDIVANLTIGGNQAARIYNRLAERIAQINRSLSSDERWRVEQLLIYGDEKGLTYSVDDLFAGNIPVVDKAGNPQKGAYTVKEIDAYVQFRTMYDELWHVQNEAAYRHFKFLGAQELHIKDGAKLVVKDSKRGAKNIPDNSMQTMVHEITAPDELAKIGKAESGERILVAVGAGSDYRVLTADEVTALRDKGFRAFKFHYHRDADGHKIRYVLAAPDGDSVKIATLRRQVLQYADGYVPRIYKPGHVFIKDSKFRTVAGFDGIKSAQKYLDTQRAAYADRGEKFDLEIKRDKQLPYDEMEMEKFSSFGGLFFRGRGDAPVVNPDTGKTIERFDVVKATQMYLSGIAEMLPLNEYRSVVIRQFQDAVNEVARKNGQQRGFLDMHDLHSPISTGDNAADATFNSVREYLFTHLAIPSAEESRLAKTMGSMVDYMEGKPWLSSTRSFLRNNMQADPVRGAKAVVFHTYLGCFNPRQLVVQIQNASLAVSAYPQHALPAFLDYLKMRTVLFMSKAEVDAVSMASGLDLTDATQMTALLRRSGYVDSIFQNSDYTSLSAGLGGGMSTAAHYAGKISTLPFLEGELGSRMISFSIAMRRWRAANPGKKIVSDVDLQNILQDSMRLSMNMQKENAAKFQTNTISSVPLQFFQVQAKFWENVAGGLLHNTGKAGHTGWSRKEAAQILAGQLAIYGTVGVPVASGVASAAKDWMSEGDAQQFNAESPLAAESIDEGGLGIMMRMLGFNTVVTEELSLVASIDDSVLAKLTAAIAEAVSGSPSSIPVSDLAPAAGVAMRAGGAIGAVARNMTYAVTAQEELTDEAIMESLSDIAAIASSWNNLQKSTFYQNMRVQYTKGGDPLRTLHAAEYNTQTALMDAMGFKEESEFNTYSAIKDNKDYKAMLAWRVTLLKKGMIANAADRRATASSFINGALNDLGPTERAEVIKEALRDLTGKTVEQSSEQKLFQRYLEGRNIDPNTNLAEMLSD